MKSIRGIHRPNPMLFLAYSYFSPGFEPLQLSSVFQLSSAFLILEPPSHIGTEGRISLLRVILPLRCHTEPSHRTAWERHASASQREALPPRRKDLLYPSNARRRYALALHHLALPLPRTASPYLCFTRLSHRMALPSIAMLDPCLVPLGIACSPTPPCSTLAMLGLAKPLLCTTTHYLCFALQSRATASPSKTLPQRHQAARSLCFAWHCRAAALFCPAWPRHCQLSEAVASLYTAFAHQCSASAWLC